MRFFVIVTLLLCSSLGWADYEGSLGDAARDITSSVQLVSDFVGTASLMLGILAVFGAFFRYLQYRVNPLAVPLGQSALLLALGILLIALPFAYLLFGAGIPFRPPHL